MPEAQPEIRAYGPGKFPTVIDSVIYKDAVENGVDDEMAYAGWGWKGLLRGGLSGGDQGLNEAETEFLSSKVGAILTLDVDDVVGVDYFDDEEELDFAWDTARADYDDFVGEGPDMDDEPISVTSSLLEEIEQQGREDAENNGVGRGVPPSSVRIDDWAARGVTATGNPKLFGQLLDAWRQGVYKVILKKSNHAKKAAFLRKASGSEIERTMRKAVTTLGQGGIPALVVGGFAVQEHGYPRFTTDVDLVVPDVALAREYLSIRGFKPNPGSSMTLTDRETKVEVDLLPAGGSVGPGPLSLPKVDGLSAGTVNIVDLKTLIETKLSSSIGSKGRMKDGADVQELIKANNLKQDYQVDSAVQEAYTSIWQDTFGG